MPRRHQHSGGRGHSQKIDRMVAEWHGRKDGSPTGKTLQIEKRQGGSSTNWATPGTTSYTPEETNIQTGVLRIVDVSNGFFGNATVTFPTAFSQPPILLCTAINTSNGDNDTYTMIASARTPTTTTVVISWWSVVDGGSPYDWVDVAWLAIGPA